MSVVDELDFEVSVELAGADVLLALVSELGVVLVELGVVEVDVELVELGVDVSLELVELVELGVVDMSVLCDLLRVDLLQPVRHNAVPTRAVALMSLSFCRLMSFLPRFV